MEQAQRKRIKYTILIISLTVQAMNAMSLIISGVAKAHPEAPVTSAQLVFTLMNISSVAGVLAASPSARIMPKRDVVIIGDLAACAGAVLALLFGDSLLVLYVSGIVIGIGCGILRPTISSMIVQLFSGDERTATVGHQAIFVSIGGLLFNTFGAFLAGIHWKDTYLMFFLFIVAAVITLIFLPKGEKEAAMDGKKQSVSPFALVLGGMSLVFGLCWMTFYANVTLLVDSLGLGGARQAGYITMAYSAGAIIINLFLKKILKASGKFCFTVSFVISAVAFWLFSFASGLPLLLAAGVILGIAFGIYMSVGTVVIPLNVSPLAITTTISIFTAGVSLGGFLNPYVITNLAVRMGGTVSTRFLLSAVIQTVLLLATGVVSAKTVMKTP